MKAVRAIEVGMLLFHSSNFLIFLLWHKTKRFVEHFFQLPFFLNNHFLLLKTSFFEIYLSSPAFVFFTFLFSFFSFPPCFSTRSPFPFLPMAGLLSFSPFYCYASGHTKIHSCSMPDQARPEGVSLYHPHTNTSANIWIRGRGGTNKDNNLHHQYHL